MLTNIVFEGRSVHGKVYVAESSPPILGWRHQYDLHIFLDPRAIPHVFTIESDVSLEQVQLDNALVFSISLQNLRNANIK